jgi:hypothetical protein
MFADAPSIEKSSSASSAILPATGNSSVPEKEVVYDVSVVEDNTANV